MVVPNSFQKTTLFFFIATFVFSLFFIRFKKHFNIIIIFWIFNSIVTFFYVIVGINNGAPDESFLQIIFVYVIAPLLWICITRGVIDSFNVNFIIKYIILICFLSSVSVLIFYYFYFSGSDNVYFFISTPNITYSEGRAAATMHVYGSFLFFTGSIVSVPLIIKNIFTRYVIILSIVLVCITSGRSALLLTLFISFLLFIYYNFFSLKVKFHINRKKIVLFFISFTVFFYFLLENVGIDFFGTISSFFDEFNSFGGNERISQFKYLLEGIVDHFGLGAGHGIGVKYIRNFDYPWRYELIWVAMVYRVGIFGTLIYSLIFLYYTYSFILSLNNKRADEIDKFMFGGFISSLLASFTNPYIESFAFQWMFILPIVHHFSKIKERSHGLVKG